MQDDFVILFFNFYHNWIYKQFCKYVFECDLFCIYSYFNSKYFQFL